MFIRDKIVFPFRGRTDAIDIAGRMLRVRIERKFDDRAAALELTAKPDRNSIRVPLDLLRAFEEMFPTRWPSTVTRSICVRWNGVKDPTFISCKSVTAWPTAGASRWANWVQWNGSIPTWVGHEPDMHRESGSGHVVLHAPRSKVASSASDAGQSPQNVQLQLWSTMDRPHLWPEYALYTGNDDQLILYTMGGLANGRFKLASRQLDDFRALEGKAALWLGFYDEAQGIDVAQPIDRVKLTAPKNLDKPDPYYLVEPVRSALALRRTLDDRQLALDI